MNFFFGTECPPLPSAIPHGFVTGTGSLEGSLNKFSCELGYSLIGVEMLVCKDTGAWSNPLPRCLIGINNHNNNVILLVLLSFYIFFQSTPPLPRSPRSKPFYTLHLRGYNIVGDSSS